MLIQVSVFITYLSHDIPERVCDDETRNWLKGLLLLFKIYVGVALYKLAKRVNISETAWGWFVFFLSSIDLIAKRMTKDPVESKNLKQIFLYYWTMCLSTSSHDWFFVMCCLLIIPKCGAQEY